MGKQQRAQPIDTEQIAGNCFEQISVFFFFNVRIQSPISEQKKYSSPRKGDHPVKPTVSHCPGRGQKKRAAKQLPLH